MQNNIVIKKVYADNDLVELEVLASSEIVRAQQCCYIQDTQLEGNARKIIAYSQNCDKDCYAEFGRKDGNYTPAFSLKFLKADTSGHLKVEVDIEIADNDERKHRCCFYVDCELGAAERFGISLMKLIKSEPETECRLYE